MTYTELIEEKIKELEDMGCSVPYHGGDECCWNGYNGELKKTIIEKFRFFASAIHEHDREEFREMIPKKWTMKAALDTGSEVGAGCTIEHNSIVDELTTKLDSWKG